MITTFFSSPEVQSLRLHCIFCHLKKMFALIKDNEILTSVLDG